MIAHHLTNINIKICSFMFLFWCSQKRRRSSRY